jgi:hypothetical protein
MAKSKGLREQVSRQATAVAHQTAAQAAVAMRSGARGRWIRDSNVAEIRMHWTCRTSRL